MPSWYDKIHRLIPVVFVNRWLDTLEPGVFLLQTITHVLNQSVLDIVYSNRKLENVVFWID